MIQTITAQGEVFIAAKPEPDSEKPSPQLEPG
jgi:hypothetical protein